MKKNVGFWVTFGAVLVPLGGLFVYFVIHCYEIAEMHIEPQLDVAVPQALIGLITALIFSRIKYFKTNRYWYIIPLLLISFAVMDLMTIVPCPRCAEF